MRLALLACCGLLVACGSSPGGGSGDAGGGQSDASVMPTADAGSPGFDAGQETHDGGQVISLGTSWGNVQFPPFITSTPNVSTTVYGQLWIDGRTQQPGVTAGVEAELGFGPSDTAPTTAAWHWVSATFNVDVGNNDEFKAELVSPTAGLFDYAFRYRLEPGADWTYADRSDDGRKGSDDGYQSENAGRLAVKGPGAVLKVATQNLHCIDGAVSTRLDAAAARFSQLDLDAVTLQEICLDATLGNTAEVLAARLRTLTSRPWRHFFIETHVANGTTSEGVGVITPLPVAQLSTLTLPTVSFGRASLRVVVASSVGMLSVSTEHLSFESTPAGVQDRLDQINAIIPFEQAVAPKVAAQVVAGDFNSGPSADPANRLSTSGFTDVWSTLKGTASGFTYPASAPSERIDFIFVRGLTPTDASLEFTQGQVSDHLGLSARLTP